MKKDHWIVSVWQCEVIERFDDEPAYRVFAPQDSDEEELKKFLIRNGYEGPGSTCEDFWLGESSDDASETPDEDDLILERGEDGKLRVKEY